MKVFMDRIATGENDPGQMDFITDMQASNGGLGQWSLKADHGLEKMCVDRGMETINRAIGRWNFPGPVRLPDADRPSTYS
jgi:hypothetical protein